MKVSDILRVKGNTLYTIHPDDTLLKALAINIGSVGEATTVSVRPERILLGEAAKSCDNLVSGSEIPSFLETQIIPSVRLYKRCCFR